MILSYHKQIICMGRYYLILPAAESLQYLHTTAYRTWETILHCIRGGIPKQPLIYNKIILVVREILAFSIPGVFHI